MYKKIIIDPVTRISGVLSIEVEVEGNKVVDAKTSGSMFRGFEKMLKGRPPKDAPYITERICGICSTAHGYVATLAIEDVIKMNIDNNAKMIRDLIHGCDLIQSHMRQFYLFALPDYISGNYGVPSFREKLSDDRVPKAISEKIFNHYLEALDMSRNAHKLLAILGGKAPHNHGIFPGGASVVLDEGKRAYFNILLGDIEKFIEEKMQEDTFWLGKFYDDYFNIGSSGDNFLSFGMLDGYEDKEINYVNPAVIKNGQRKELNYSNVTEDIESSWYTDKVNNYPKNFTDGELNWDTDINKVDAYSFIKSPRYEGEPMEVGPLARMKLAGLYEAGSSAMARVTARNYELLRVCRIMKKLIEKINIDYKNIVKINIAEEGNGVGYKDTMRGALCHFVGVKEGVIDNYDIITPSAWNLGPANGYTKGVVEKALLGTEIRDLQAPIELGRIVRSFDPCISCATHVIRNGVEIGISIL